MGINRLSETDERVAAVCDVIITQRLISPLASLPIYSINVM